MPNVSRRTAKRWSYTASFDPETKTADITGTVNEIQELQDIVENLPDWNTVAAITIIYNLK